MQNRPLFSGASILIENISKRNIFNLFSLQMDCQSLFLIDLQRKTSKNIFFLLYFKENNIKKLIVYLFSEQMN